MLQKYVLCLEKNENFITNPGARSRYISRYYANKYNKQEGKLQEPFKFKGVITKIVLKTRPWQNEIIIQGMRFYFNDGKIKNIGISAEEKLPEKLGSDFQVFQVPRGQWLHNAKIEANSFISKLEFFTNIQEIDYSDESDKFVADRDVFVTSEKSWFLSGIQGNLWNSDGKSFICDVQFIFDHYKPDVNYYEQLIKLKS